MSNTIRAIFSALRQAQNAPNPRAPERGTQTQAPARVAGLLPRHLVFLTATASFGFAGIPEEIRIRDINEKGLYFYTKLDMPVGSSFDIVAVLPPNISGHGEARRVHYEAKVVRVERDFADGNYGVGASIRRCETFPMPAIDPNGALLGRSASESVQPSETAQENIQPIQESAEPVPVAASAAPVKELIAAAKGAEETVSPAVVDDLADSERARFAPKSRKQVIVEKLAAAALRAGISIEEFIRLVDSGLTPAELIDIIEARLMARVR